MKNAALTALIPTLLTSPLMAHSGPHMHTHSTELGIFGLAALLMIAAAAFVMQARK